MKIGIIQASSQRSKNKVLYSCTCRAVEKNGREDTVVNYDVFPENDDLFSYIETSLNISFLLSSGAVDFIITGCSSGQGMMLACNSLPGVLCGFIQNPQDPWLRNHIFRERELIARPGKTVIKTYDTVIKAVQTAGIVVCLNGKYGKEIDCGEMTATETKP
jgi:ribose 5-phosphate isomerase RpiB